MKTKLMLLLLLFIAAINLDVSGQQVNSVSVGAATGSATYGTASTLTYPVTVEVNASKNSSGNVNVSVGSLPSGVTAPAITITYTFPNTGSQNQTASFSGTLTLNISTSAKATANDESFGVTATLSSSSVNGSGSLTIGKKSLTGSFTTADKEYDGNTNATVASTSLSGKVGSDVISLSGTASFDNKNVGTGKTVSLTGASLSGTDAGNYTLSSVSTTTADITAKSITGTFTASNKQYDGDANATVSLRSLVGVISPDVVTLSGGIASFDNKNAGTEKTVTLTGASLTGAASGNYTLLSVSTTTADITAKSITGTFTADNKEYDGDASATVTGRSLIGVISPDVVELSGGTASFNNKNAGNDKTVSLTGATLSGAASGNYTLTSVSATNATITKKSITGSFIADNKAYDGNTNAAVTSTSLNGSLETDAVSLSGGAASFDNKDAGNGKTVTLTDASLSGADAVNYTLSSVTTTSADISKRAITITADAKSKVYGDADPSLTAQVSNLVIGDPASGSLIRAAGDNIGTHAITQGTYTYGSNYDETFIGADLTINKRAITITADAKSKAYGDNDPAFTATLTAGTLVGTDASSGTLSRIEGEDVGAYAINQGSYNYSNNYDVTFISANLTINKRPVTVTAQAASKVYGENDPAFTATLTAGTLVGDDASSGTLSRTTGEHVGAYPINQGTFTYGNNYQINFVGADFTIDKRAITITADAKSKTYGDADPLLTATVTSGSIIGDDIASGSLVRAAGNNVGDHFINKGTYTYGSNYQETFVQGELTITKRAITITAAAKSKVYGDADPAFTATVTSGTIVGTDAASGSMSRDAGHNVGPYAINQGSYSFGNNYEENFIGASLTITKAPLQVSVSNASREYGTANPSWQVNYSGYKNSENFASSGITGSPAISTAAISSSTVGSYPIEISAGSLESNNYSFTFQDGSLNVTKAPLSVSANDITFTYNGSAYGGTPTVTYTGFRNSETSANLSGTLTFLGDYKTAVNSGIYEIMPAGLTSDNYQISFIKGNLYLLPQNGIADGKTYYSGQTYFWTSSSTSSTAQLTLSATLKNQTPGLGSITTAKVSFYIIKDNSRQAIAGAQNVPVGPVTPGNLDIGVAVVTVPYNLGNSSAESFEIGVEISGNYTNDYEEFSSHKQVTVAKLVPGGQIVGGGSITNAETAGMLVDNSLDALHDFGFEVKYNKSKKSVQGYVVMNVYSKRDPLYGNLGTEERKFRLKSNSIISLNFPNNANKAIFTSKANVAELIPGSHSVGLDGNCTMVMEVTPGTSCAPGQIAITVYKSKGGLWFSSRWETDATQTSMKEVVVAAPINSTISLGGNEINCVGQKTMQPREVVRKSDLKVMAMPNPSSNHFTLKFDGGTGDLINARIIDVAGRLVKVIPSIPAGSSMVIGSELQPGVYFINVQQGNHSDLIKIVKTK
jgi:large repetitive protein